MSNTTMYDGKCKVRPSGKHNWKVARKRGKSKVRYKCTECALFSEWVRTTKTAKGENLNLGEWQVRDDMDSLTVADLKQRCKQAGITGYSKMKRDDLIAALNSVLV